MTTTDHPIPSGCPATSAIFLPGLVIASMAFWSLVGAVAVRAIG